MVVVALQYHDVIDGPDFEASGVTGRDAGTYKLSRAQFEAHIAAVSARVPPQRPYLLDVLGCAESTPRPASEHCVLFTFDDGGASAVRVTADLLEAWGWRGIFLVTTDWIGREGFMREHELRELDRRGHIIGAHSCSHPLHFARYSRAEMRAEWIGSVDRLVQVLGHNVSVGSVPGGYYSDAVADVASECGIRTLFTSEPVRAVRVVRTCRVIGRYTLRSWSPAAEAAGLAAGDRVPRLRQWVGWNAKKVAKFVGGNDYLRLRAAILGQVPHRGSRAG